MADCRQVVEIALEAPLLGQPPDGPAVEPGSSRAEAASPGSRSISLGTFMAPLAVLETVTAAWPVIKGFDPAAIAAESGETTSRWRVAAPREPGPSLPRAPA